MINFKVTRWNYSTARQTHSYKTAEVTVTMRPSSLVVAYRSRANHNCWTFFLLNPRRRPATTITGFVAGIHPRSEKCLQLFCVRNVSWVSTCSKTDLKQNYHNYFWTKLLSKNSIYLATVIDKNHQIEGGILLILKSHLPLNKLTAFSTWWQQVSKLQLCELTCVNG